MTPMCAGPCQRELPLTEEFWDRDARQEHGFRKVCKQCRTKARKRKEAIDVDERIKRLDRAALRAITQMANSDKDCPHVAEMFQIAVQLMGGGTGLMKHYVANMLQAAPGSQTRQRMLDAILKLGVETTKSGAASKPAHMMNDEDLRIELERRGVQLKRLPQMTVETVEVSDG